MRYCDCLPAMAPSRFNGGKGDLLMVQRSNRKAWALVVVVTVGVFAVCLVLGGTYLRQTPADLRPVGLLSRQGWRFGRDDSVTMAGPTVTHYHVIYYYGFFFVRVERRPPASVLAAVKRLGGPPPSRPLTPPPAGPPTSTPIGKAVFRE